MANARLCIKDGKPVRDEEGKYVYERTEVSDDDKAWLARSNAAKETKRAGRKRSRDIGAIMATVVTDTDGNQRTIAEHIKVRLEA